MDRHLGGRGAFTVVMNRISLLSIAATLAVALPAAPASAAPVVSGSGAAPVALEPSHFLPSSAPDGSLALVMPTDEGSVTGSAPAPAFGVALRGPSGAWTTVHGGTLAGEWPMAGAALDGGRAFVAWGAGGTSVRAALCAVARCAPAHRLDGAAGRVRDVEVAADRSGRAVAAWIGDHGLRVGVHTSVWAPTQVLDAKAKVAAVAGGRRGLLVLTADGGGVKTAVLGSGSRFTAPRAIERGDTKVYAMKAVATETGYVVAWQITPSSARIVSVRVANLDRDGRRLSASAATFATGSALDAVAASPSGGRSAVTAVRTVAKTGERTWQVAIGRAGRPFLRTDLGVGETAPQLVVRADGSATAAWWGQGDAVALSDAPATHRFGPVQPVATPAGVRHVAIVADRGVFDAVWLYGGSSFTGLVAPIQR
jgi:hypothetical protein